MDNFMNISVCIIVKNEEKHIENCLKPLSKLGCEIVVVDTGSTDDTKTLAKKYTDRIYDFQWSDDFSKARNYAVSKAENDFIFVIDADEYIIKFEKEKILQFFEKNPEKIGRLKLIDQIKMPSGEKTTSTFYVSRFFNRKKFRFEGAIHEQIVSAEDTNMKFQTKNLDAFATHHGYDLSEEEKIKKAKRNIEILKKELERQRGDSKETVNIPYTLHQLGKSYYFMADYKNAKKYFLEALDYDLDSDLEYVVDMICSLGYTLIYLEEYKEALLLESVYDAFSTSADFLFLMGLIYMNNAKFADAITEFKKAVQITESAVDGVNSYRAFYNIAVIYEVAGDIKNAKVYYKKAGDYLPAKNRLAELK